MDIMSRCRVCQSTDLKIYDLDMANRLVEGETPQKFSSSKKQFVCNGCGNKWESKQQVDNLYLEYLQLKEETKNEAVVRAPGQPYPEPKHIDFDKLNRKKEIAKMLTSEYRSDIYLNVGEWLELYQDTW